MGYVQSPHLRPVLFRWHWLLNQGSPLSYIALTTGGTNGVHNSEPKHSSVMFIFIIHVPSHTLWKFCPRVLLTTKNNIDTKVSILLQLYPQWPKTVIKIWFSPNVPTSTPHQRGTKHLDHWNHGSKCLLHNSNCNYRHSTTTVWQI